MLATELDLDVTLVNNLVEMDAIAANPSWESRFLFVSVTGNDDPHLMCYTLLYTVILRVDIKGIDSFNKENLWINIMRQPRVSSYVHSLLNIAYTSAAFLFFIMAK